MLLLGSLEGAQAEAFDGGEDVVGGLGPLEGLGVGVDGVDRVPDSLFKLLRGEMDAAAPLFFSEHRKEAFHLVQPGGTGGGGEEVVLGASSSHRRHAARGATSRSIFGLTVRSATSRS